MFVSGAKNLIREVRHPQTDKQTTIVKLLKLKQILQITFKVSEGMKQGKLTQIDEPLNK